MGSADEQPDHRRGDARPLNEVELQLEDLARIAVEADDEAALHLEPGPLDRADLLRQIAAHVLMLLAFLEARRDRRLDPQEHAAKTRPASSGPSSSASSARFTDASVRKSICGRRRVAPRHQRPQKLLHAPLVADEIVVDEKHRPLPARVHQRIELREHLLRASSSAACGRS